MRVIFTTGKAIHLRLWKQLLLLTVALILLSGKLLFQPIVGLGKGTETEEASRQWVTDTIERFSDRIQESIEEVTELRAREATEQEELDTEALEDAEQEVLEGEAMGTFNRNVGTYLALVDQITDETPWLIRVNQTTCVVTIYRALTLEINTASRPLLTKRNLAELVRKRIIAGDSALSQEVETLAAGQPALIEDMQPEENLTVTVCIPVYACPCSVGSPGRETPCGTFYIQDHLRWHELNGPSWGQWCSHFAPSYLFHSLPYVRPNDPNSLEEDAYNQIGQPASHGCVRLTAVDAKYIFDHVPTGGQIEIFYGTEADDLLGKPDRPYVGEWTKGYDPTDPEYKPEAGQ